MAKTIKGITVEINGKTEGLTKALEGVNKECRTLQTNLTAVNKGLKLDPGNTDLLKEKQKLLANSVDATRTKLDQLKSVQEQVKQQYANGEIDQGQYVQFQNEIVKTQAKLEALEKEQKQFGNVASQTIKAASDQLEEMGGKVTKAGEAITGVGVNITKGVTAPILAAGTACVAAFNDVDDGVDTIVRATGASGDALDGLTASYEAVASKIPAELGDVAAAVGEVNTRFQSTGDALESQTTLFLQFASITGGDVVSSVDTADKLLETFNLTADDTGGMLGMVAKAAQDTGINAQSLMQDVQSNSATFKELGFSMEQSIGLMAQMDANGVDSSTALAGLKKAVVNLTDAGMSESEALGTVIDSIKNASSETEALQIAQETFGTKGAAEMSTAIREGRIDLDSLSASMGDYGSVVEDTYNGTVDGVDSFKTATNAGKIALTEFGSTISDMLGPILQKVTAIITKITEKLKGMDEGQKQQIVTIALVVAAIGPAIAIIGTVVSTVGHVITTVGKLGNALSLLAANPVVLIIAAIVAVVAALVLAYNKCEWFRNGVNAAITKVKEVWTAGVEGIKSVLSAVQNAWNTATGAIKAVTTNVMGAVTSTVEEKLTNMKTAYDNAGGGIKGAAAAAMEGVKGYFTAGLTFVDKLTGGKLSEIEHQFSSKIDAARNAVRNGIEGIKSLFNFNWSLPSLKLPHFSVSGSFSLNPPRVPHLAVDWYANGGILNGAQLFGTLGGNLLGGGEAGPEAVLPLASFYDNLEGILSKATEGKGITVQMNVEHFENRTNQSIDELANRVASKIEVEVEKKGGAWA